jgi:hypothetical protein
MIRAIASKEWHEQRSKYIGYWATMNVPFLVIAVAVAISSYARLPFADLSNKNILKHLPLALAEPALLVTIFLLMTGYFAVATCSPENEDRSLFFIFELPVSRIRYTITKLLIGGIFVVAAVWFATLLPPAGAYGMMLASGKVTWSGSSAAFWAVMAAAVRLAAWCSVISLGVFASSALVAALIPRWWLAALASIAVTIGLFVATGNFFDFSADMPEQNNLSVNVSWGSNPGPWVGISRALEFKEINSLGRLHWQPLLSAVAFSALLMAAIAWIYQRKELDR